MEYVVLSPRKDYTMSESEKIGIFNVRPYVRNGQKSGQWVLDIPPMLGGRRKRRLFESREDAVNAAKALDRAYRRGELTPKPEPEKSEYVFSELVDLWLQRELDRVETGKKKPISVETDRFRLKCLLEYFGNVEPSLITETRIHTFQKARIKAGKSPITINSDMRVLRKILNWSKRSKLISEVPDLGDPLPETRTTHYIPTPLEVEKIFESLPSRLKLLIRLMFETGCRPGEAYNLTWDCVNEVQGTIDIKPVDGWTPKTQSSIRTIPLSDYMITEIRKLTKTGSLVFPNQRGGKITDMRKAFQTAVKNAGITQKITPKTFRKVFATMAVVMGVPETVLQSILGHAPGSTVTREYYVHHDEKSKRDAVNLLSQMQQECCKEDAA